jgi:diguanylate cyclase (GGDEF)-like protein
MSEHRPRILVVEDDPDTRELIAEVLGMHFGPENIRTAGSAEQAMRSNLSDVDVVLQDYNLPDMNGLELLALILERTDVPVIFVTSENVSQTAAEAIRCGAADYVTKMGDYLFALPIVIEKNLRQYRIRQDRDRLEQQRQEMLRELQAKNKALEQSLEQVRLLATTDPLTGLANRRRFNELLERYFNEARRYDFDLTCCMGDLDHFKLLNDALGHQAGDRLLISTARIVGESLRGTDIAARYGGDEIVMLLPHTSLDRATSVGQRIREEVEAANRRDHPDLPFVVTMSMGLASLRHHRPENPEMLVQQADRALYVGKQAGKNSLRVFGD